MPALLRRWWITAPLALIVLVLGILAVVHSIGASDLAAAKAALRTTGDIEDYTGWRNQPLPGDPAASDALVAALHAFPEADISKPYGTAFDPTASATSAAAARLALPGILARQATAAAAIRTAMAVPGAVINARHRLATDPLAAAKQVLNDPNLVTNLLATRAYAQHLAARARLDGDPAALTDLRALVRSMAASDFLIDGMILIAIQDISDRTHLALVREQRLPPAELDAWLLDGVDPVPVLDRSLTAERCAFGGLMFEIAIADPEAFRALSDVYVGPFSRLYWWAVGEGDAAHLTRTLHASQVALRTGTGAPAVLPATGWDRWTRTISSIALPNIQESLNSALLAEAKGRMVRAAALLVRDGGSPAAIAPLLDRGPTRVRLGYEPLGGKRIRIAVDTSKPQPGLVALGGLRADRCLGAPRQADPGVMDRESIEFDLP
ncbi:MAG: hypothetical protein RLZZ127_499 [Planctomycetota bacterium]